MTAATQGVSVLCSYRISGVSDRINSKWMLQSAEIYIVRPLSVVAFDLQSHNSACPCTSRFRQHIFGPPVEIVILWGMLTQVFCQSQLDKWSGSVQRGSTGDLRGLSMIHEWGSTKFRLGGKEPSEVSVVCSIVSRCRWSSESLDVLSTLEHVGVSKRMPRSWLSVADISQSPVPTGTQYHFSQVGNRINMGV